MKWKYNDGGRKKAGYKGETGDCATRAISIATMKPYQEVYDEINEIAKTERISKRKKGKSSARTGVYKRTFKKYLEEKLGWKWTPTMLIGQGCRVHLTEKELPKGILIVRVSKHYVAVINGIIHDTYDPSRRNTRCVYGYWTKE